MRGSTDELVAARGAISEGLEQFVTASDEDFADGCICLGFITYAEVASADGSRREMACITGSVDGSPGMPWQLKGYFGYMTPIVGRSLS